MKKGHLGKEQPVAKFIVPDWGIKLSPAYDCGTLALCWESTLSAQSGPMHFAPVLEFYNNLWGLGTDSGM